VEFVANMLKLQVCVRFIMSCTVVTFMCQFLRLKYPAMIHIVHDDPKAMQPIFLHILYICHRWSLTSGNKRNNYVTCWKCPPCSAMNAFTHSSCLIQPMEGFV
jgi:hypothetical protein